jgi:hypothetical protein
VALDLTGGLADDLEEVMVAKPDDPELRESTNAWIWNEDAEFGCPRIGVEAVGDQWDTHDVQATFAVADGRVLGCYAPGPVRHPLTAGGSPRILGAGPLSFEVVEPYGLVEVRFDGEAHATTAEALIGGAARDSGDLVPVSLEVDLRPALPPWMNGSLLPEAREVLDTQDEGALMGHPWRFEQLCRATGRVGIGDESWRLDGGAVRIRRQSIRRMATFRGHVWQTGIFPSGRGFGFNVYPERADGLSTYNEGFVFDGDGDLVPARVTTAPWLRRLEQVGEVSLVLQTVDGRTVEIDGETTAATFMVLPPDVGGGLRIQQALVRYVWDGERGAGMIERSTLLAEMS